jgi:hypothetical protein
MYRFALNVIMFTPNANGDIDLSLQTRDPKLKVYIKAGTQQ